MKAEQMFKKLGYELTKNNESKIEYTFSLGSATVISPNIHKAITKQMEELGWLDD